MTISVRVVLTHLVLAQEPIQTILSGMARAVHPAAHAVSLTTLRGSQRLYPVLQLMILSYVCVYKERIHLRMWH